LSILLPRAILKKNPKEKYMNSRPLLSALLALLIAAPLYAGQAEDKAAKVDEHFKKMDTNNDGKISFEEYMSGWYKAGADKVTVKAEEIDTNKDGQVTWQELHIHFKKKFDAADANKDGYIGKKEAVVLFNY
jgi:hypothetical protein